MSWRLGPGPLLVAALVSALPALLQRRLPTEDGPAHLGAVAVLRDVNPAAARYLFVDHAPVPDLGAHLVLTAAESVLSPVGAQRLVLAILLLGIPLATWYAVSAVNREAGWLALLAIPLAGGWFLHMGYWSFLLGVASAMVTLGWWLRRDTAPTAGAATGLAALLLLTWICHLVSFALVLLILGARAALARERPARHLVVLVGGAAPALVLSGVYLLTHRDSGGTSRIGLLRLARDLVTLGGVVAAYQRRELVFSTLLAAVLLALTAVALRQVRRGAWSRLDRGTTLAPLGLAALYVLAPDSLGGGGDLGRRIALLGVLALLVALAQVPFPIRVQYAAAGAAVVAAVGLSLLRLPSYAGLGADVDDFLAGAALVPTGSTVVPLSLSDRPSSPGRPDWGQAPRPVLQAAGWLMTERGDVDLSLYEAQFRYFPVRFRPGLDPVPSLGRGRLWLGEQPPDVDLAAYAVRTRGRVDAVLVWGRSVALPAVLADPVVASLDRQLAQGFRLAGRSPRGLLEVWLRR